MKNNEVPNILERNVIIKEEGNIYYATSSSIDITTVVPRYTSLIRSRSLDLYQTGRIPNEFFP
jgi:hypothetical protein